MKYDFDSCIDRTKVMSIKWSPKLRQEMYGESDVIPLGIADMDFKAAPAVAKAIQDRAAHENYGYGYLADEFRAVGNAGKRSENKTDPGMQPSKSKRTPLDERGADPHGKYLY